MKKDKRALFFVNSLTNGGAERVCVNLANELMLQKYEVDFILLNQPKNNECKYELNSGVNILDLNINTNNKLKKIFTILKSVRKINKFIKNNEKNGKYELITSHLPMSNLLTLMSTVRNRALYVFHLNLSFYGKSSNIIFRNFIKIILKNKKIVSVSEGVKNECVNLFKMDGDYIKTIYNPINLLELKSKSEEELEFEDKYILQIGRFTKQKRQDRMLNVFFKGNFYKDYKLVFLGSGELEVKIKSEARSLGIEDRVEFLGWQSNSYKWMKNCEVLVNTSDNEAFPMTLIEGIACGAKIVSSNCNFGPNEILLNEYSKYLVEPDNIDEYIEKINDAVKNYPNTENRILDKCISRNVVKEYLDYM